MTSRAIVIILPGMFEARSYIASGLVAKLVGRGHLVTLICPRAYHNAISDRVLLGAIETYAANRWRRWLRARFRTMSYVERAAAGQVTYQHKIRTRRSRVEVGLYRALLRLGSLERGMRWLEDRIRPMPAATRLMRAWRPDVLVSVTSIQGAEDVELVKAAQRAGVLVVVQPVSWDTLTSKGALLYSPPDAWFVWGQDSARHVERYHA